MTELFSAVVDMNELFSAVVDMTQLFSAVVDTTELFSAVVDTTELFSAVVDMIELFSAVVDMNELFSVAEETTVRQATPCGQGALLPGAIYPGWGTKRWGGGGSEWRGGGAQHLFNVRFFSSSYRRLKNARLKCCATVFLRLLWSCLEIKGWNYGASPLRAKGREECQCPMLFWSTQRHEES